MAGNSFGTLLKLTTFGESHGFAIGGVLDGFPPGFELNLDLVQKEVARRRPGQASITTSRSESDQVEFLSGIWNGKSLGTPIGFLVRNEDHRSEDYQKLKDVYRPSHADYVYDKKYGIRDHRGGGRSSARETVARVIAGALVKQWLHSLGIEIRAYVSQIGSIEIPSDAEVDESMIEQNAVRCPHPPTAEKMLVFLEELMKEGDSTGGVIHCSIKGVPPGLGEPVFDKLNADLAKAMMSINAAKGFELGSGFHGVTMLGSQHNDAMTQGGRTTSNNSGGILGGISNGEVIYFRTAFKPVATIQKRQNTITNQGAATTLEAKGRHDPCVVPRAVPIVEAMSALVIGDHLLRQKCIQP